MDARVLPPQQVLYERGLAWAPAQPRSGTARTLVLKTLGPGPMWMPGYSRPSRCFMNVVLPGRRHSAHSGTARALALWNVWTRFLPVVGKAGHEALHPQFMKAASLP